MRYFEIEGENPESIINSFIEEKKISKDFINYLVIDQGSKGILGIAKRSAKIKIEFNDEEYIKKQGKLVLSEFLDLANFPDHHITTKQNNDQIVFMIEAITPELLIGKHAITLDAIEYLLEKMLRVDYDSQLDVVVDVNSYRERSIATILDKAKRLADEVLHTGKSRKLPALNSSMRKEVHKAIKNIEGLTTLSIGEGAIKYISIMLEKKISDSDSRGWR